MKRFNGVCISILILSFLLVGCNQSMSNTGSYIEVLNKEINKKDEYVIGVHNPYDKNSPKFNIIIDDENLWNLIEVGHMYLASYEYRDINKRVKLVSINLPDEADEK